MENTIIQTIAEFLGAPIGENTVGQIIAALLGGMFGIVIIVLKVRFLNKEWAWRLNMKQVKYEGLDPKLLVRSKEWERRTLFNAIVYIFLGIFCIFGAFISLQVA